PGSPTSKDSARALELDGDSYTACVVDAAAKSGTAVLELYDIGTDLNTSRPRLINVSARAMAGGELSLIAGFTIDGHAPMTILLRGLGPALVDFAGAGILADP